MLPKSISCFEALDAGCFNVLIIDNSVPRTLVLEIFTKQDIGTEITLSSWPTENFLSTLRTKK